MRPPAPLPLPINSADKPLVTASEPPATSTSPVPTLPTYILLTTISPPVWFIRPTPVALLLKKTESRVIEPPDRFTVPDDPAASARRMFFAPSEREPPV